ncbi:MAG: chromosome segregation protein SMC, partial [Dehalococcoidia bacterium]|nr:chromosome segregation protein SMC [Dehalococcoidia bacterium]
AQDKVHRTLAPRLRDALKPWLQAVTGGRYTDVTVDPETLMVQVSGDGSSWRNAALLSHGTAEQIYLLLRVAMARLLTKPGEVCPLLFDDVTVHCDPTRQNAILHILHAVSRDQQVILFSQEPETLGWAKEHLSKQRDRLIELASSGIPA